MVDICKKCDGYGITVVKGITITCDEPGCRGYISSRQMLQELHDQIEDNKL